MDFNPSIPILCGSNYFFCQTWSSLDDIHNSQQIYIYIYTCQACSSHYSLQLNYLEFPVFLISSLVFSQEFSHVQLDFFSHKFTGYWGDVSDAPEVSRNGTRQQINCLEVLKGLNISPSRKRQCEKTGSPRPLTGAAIPERPGPRPWHEGPARRGSG